MLLWGKFRVIHFPRLNDLSVKMAKIVNWVLLRSSIHRIWRVFVGTWNTYLKPKGRVLSTTCENTIYFIIGYTLLILRSFNSEVSEMSLIQLETPNYRKQENLLISGTIHEWYLCNRSFNWEHSCLSRKMKIMIFKKYRLTHQNYF